MKHTKLPNPFRFFKLIFDKTDARLKNAMRALGHVHMCGVLHFAWQTQDGVDGQYMISLLYRDWLVVASVGKADQTYTIQAMIGLSEVKVEETDNGRGTNFLTIFAHMVIQLHNSSNGRL